MGSAPDHRTRRARELVEEGAATGRRSREGLRRLPPILIAAGIAFGLWAIDAELRTSDAENADSPAETTRASAIEAPGADADESRPLITVRGPGTLEGRITDPDGQPIAGATLRWGPCRTLSDGEGRFALLPADGELTVEHDEYFPLHVQARDVAKLPADSDGILHLVLLSGHRLRGRVVGESGAPLAGVEVFLSADFFERETTTVLTDKDGAWTSPLLGPGPMRALFRDAEHRIARAEWSIDLHAPPPPIETKLEKGAPISIEVVDEDQRPLGDADVWLEEIAESGGVPVVRSRYLGRTGDLGELRTAIAKIERWAVRVRRAGYREERREIDDAKARQPIEIVLLEAPALEARAILATTGLPVRPTRVELEIATEERSHVESDGSTFEERISSRPPALASIESFRPVAHRGLLFQGLEDGRILVGLPRHAGRFRIVVHAAGHLHGVSPVVTYDGRRSPEPVVVRLEREERLEGLVHSRGEPVEGAEVELVALAGRDIGSVERSTFRERGPVLFRTRSRKSGRFEFATLPDGAARLEVRHPDFADWVSPPLPLPFIVARDYPVELRRALLLSGRVLDESGRGVADVPVVLRGSELTQRIEWTDSEGEFRFERLTPGTTYRIAAAALDRRGEPDLASLDDLAIVDADPGDSGSSKSPPRSRTIGMSDRSKDGTIDGLAPIALAAPSPLTGSLGGRVTIAGLPIATELRIVAVDRLEAVRDARSDADGQFLVRGLEPGSYRLNGSLLPLEGRAEVEAGRRASVELELETLSFEVEVRSNGAFVDDVGRVEIRPQGTALRLAYESTGTAPLTYSEGGLALRETLRFGRASFAGLLPGVHEIEVRAVGFLPATRRIDLDGDRTVRIELERGQILRFRLRTPDGDAFRGRADVTITRANGEVVLDRSMSIDRVLELPPLGRGTYELSVRADGFRFEKAITIPASLGR